MQAVQINQFGSVDVMEMAEVALPKLGDHQVMVQNYAVAIDPYDVKYVAGVFGPNDKWPVIPGSSVAGRVTALGAAVKDFQVGDRVVATRHLKTYAEFVPVDEKVLAKIPAQIDDTAAVAVALGGATGYQMIVERLKVQAGEQVLIQGGAGQVGAMAVQAAVERGAEVTATASPKDFAQVQALGATHVLDYHTVDYQQLPAFDAILDPIGGEVVVKEVISLKPTGHLLALGPVPAELADDKRVEHTYSRISRSTLESVLDHLAQKKWQVQIGQVVPFTLANLQEQHRLARTNQLVGKSILTFQPEKS